jgi:1,4-alpha-glucan branching enzyme
MRGNTRFKLLAPFILLGLFLACRCTPEWQLGQHQVEAPKIPVRFVYIDNKAATVCVSGSFNGWSQQSDCMSRSDDGWSVRVLLPPGRYQYAFVIDGCRWRDDPGAVLAEDDGFGIKNSVLIVE